MSEPGLGDVEAVFRRESGRVTSALVRLLGPHNLPLVEDAVQEALQRALEVWKFHGVPDNPTAWLIATAKNRAIDALRRDQRRGALAPELEARLRADAGGDDTGTGDPMTEEALRDEELRLMFACCHPRLGEEVQVALMLNLLCGFAVHEVAAAFLVSTAAMEKRLQRGKAMLAEAGALPEVTAAHALVHRDAVHRAIYVLFSEGYHGSHPVEALRVDLCLEALRLAELLGASRAIGTPATQALLALLYFSAARLPGRLDAHGDLVPLASQDRTLWDPRLLGRGAAAFEASAAGDEVTSYHLEAAIAFEHASARTHDATDWRRVLHLYDELLTVSPSPMAALSRAVVVGETEGADRGLEELAKLRGDSALEGTPFFAAAIAEQELRAGHVERARASFRRAGELARSPAERRFYEQRLATLAPR